MIIQNKIEIILFRFEILKFRFAIHNFGMEQFGRIFIQRNRNSKFGGEIFPKPMSGNKSASVGYGRTESVRYGRGSEEKPKREHGRHKVEGKYLYRE